MSEIKIEISNIQTNHTYGEYQRYFSHLLKKGKLKRFSLYEKDKLDSNRQYWKLTDDKGDTYYYELPKYIKPDSTKTAYSMKRVMHRRPARIALAIFAGAALVSLTSMIVGKSLQSNTPDPPPQPLPDPVGLFKAMKGFQDWKEANPDGDATSKYSIAELATIGMANTLYDDTKYEAETATYPRRSLMSIGFGNTDTKVPILPIKVHVDISNAFIFQNGNALEESISYSSSYLAPKVGRRDFYTINDNMVTSNSGEASSSTIITWSAKDDKDPRTKEDYEEKVGKTPDSPFLYSIDEETVLNGSSVNKKTDGSGYDININLDTTKGVARYKKRMIYLSEKTPTKFYSVKLHFTTDNNFHFLSSTVDESYDVEDALYTEGKLVTTFYYDDKALAVPDHATPIDYSPYLPENI